MAFYVAVEGLIGAGKSTVAAGIAKCSRGRRFGEPVEENPFLARFYAGERDAALPMQLQFLLARYAQQCEIRELYMRKQVLVSDYSFEKELVFAPVLLKNTRERELHARTYSHLVARVRRPDVVVFLRASVEDCLERIRFRNRKMERGIDARYLAKLARAYEKWLTGYPGRVVRVTPPRFRPESDDSVRFARELLRELR